MALHFWTQWCTGTSFTFLWIVVTTVSCIERELRANSENLLISKVESITYQRIKRSPEEETFQPNLSKKNEDLNSAIEDLFNPLNSSQNSFIGNIFRENIDVETSNDSQIMKEGIKNKPNEPKKYNPSNLKNSNNVNLETKILSSNETINEKHKIPFYNPVIKYNSNKKDVKLNFSSSNYSFKMDIPNLKIPSKLILEKKNSKIRIDETPINFTKFDRPNDTHLSDQPMESDGDLAINTTDVLDDDSFGGLSVNTTISEDDISNRTSADGRTMPSEELNVVVISGITLATAALLGIIAGGGFIIYRHRMWNKPQTLSDKCSNADSSGYIDDSTLRENSEEMYSLDNDSFLNSLEAMTIQNYWTDNVKHTKL